MKGLLEALWPMDSRLYGELRSIKGNVVVRDFVPLVPAGPERAMQQAAALSDQAYDVYFGVLPRVRKSGTSADCVPTTSVLWADVDAKKFVGGKASALRYISDFPLDPQILVDSGGGLHAYWLIREVAYNLARPVMEEIARQVRGDHTYDAARVLRVPGTLNQKYTPPVQARVLKFDLTSPIYRLSDFPQPPPVKPFFPREIVDRATIHPLPAWLVELIEDGVPKGERSEACFRAMVWLLHYGRDREDILEIFETYPSGIGAKMAEKKNGLRWFEITLRAAERVA